MPSINVMVDEFIDLAIERARCAGNLNKVRLWRDILDFSPKRKRVTERLKERILNACGTRNVACTLDGHGAQIEVDLNAVVATPEQARTIEQLRLGVAPFEFTRLTWDAWKKHDMGLLSPALMKLLPCFTPDALLTRQTGPNALKFTLLALLQYEKERRYGLVWQCLYHLVTTPSKYLTIPYVPTQTSVSFHREEVDNEAVLHCMIDLRQRLFARKEMTVYFTGQETCAAFLNTAFQFDASLSKDLAEMGISMQAFELTYGCKLKVVSE